jgi:iron complex transport system ATP-binding protein
MTNLHIEQLTYSFGPASRGYNKSETPIITDINCEFVAGQLISIMGPNGAGKTTALKLAAGLLEPSQGYIRFGDPTIDFKDASVRARRIAYLPQFQSVVWPMLVREVVALGRLPHAAGNISGMVPGFNSLRADDEESINDAMVQTNILKLQDRAIDSLSGGEQARVLLARALATQADIFLLDEPIQSLDPAGQLEVMNLLQGLAQQGKAVVISIHDMNLAAHYSDQVILMRAGKIHCFGAPQDVFTSPNIRGVFDVQILSAADRNEQLIQLDLIKD